MKFPSFHWYDGAAIYIDMVQPPRYLDSGPTLLTGCYHQSQAMNMSETIRWISNEVPLIRNQLLFILE